MQCDINTQSVPFDSGLAMLYGDRKMAHEAAAWRVA